MSETSFAGQTIVITGGERQLGLELAHRFGEAGARVVLAAQNPDACAANVETLEQAGLSIALEQLDVRDPAQSQLLVDTLVQERGQIDIWINNVQGVHIEPAETLPARIWDESLKTIVSGAFYCSQTVGRQMAQQEHGVIINVATVDGYQAIEGRVASSVANAGLMMLTKALGIEWAKKNIRVVGVALGPIATELITTDINGNEITTGVYERRTPMHRLGKLQDVVEAVFYLASAEASYVTAETVRVDGGWTAYQLF